MRETLLWYANTERSGGTVSHSYTLQWFNVYYAVWFGFN